MIEKDFQELEEAQEQVDQEQVDHALVECQLGLEAEDQEQEHL
jgi:hypothetical protein